MDDRDGSATYEDLMPFPEQVKAEIIHGHVYVQPSGMLRHGIPIGELTRKLPNHKGSGRGGQGWWIVSDMDVRFGTHDIVRPDLAGWRVGTMPVPNEGRPVEVRPDWVCEVLSPSNAAHDRKRKWPMYAAFGVPHAWLVDPAERTLEAYELGTDKRWILLGTWGDGDRLALAPFPEIDIEVGDLFLPRAPG